VQAPASEELSSVQSIARVPGRRLTAARAPAWLWAGFVLTLVSWWFAWFGPAPVAEHIFFPLWFGYILTVDGLTFVRSGSSLLARDRRRFALLFLISVPLWWLFEFVNGFLQNWRYLLPRTYTTLEYTFWASLAFSTVLPAIFVTAELVRTLPFFAPRRPWARFDPGPAGLIAVSLAGLGMFVLSLAVPRYFFPLVWIGLFLFLDPINAYFGYPSITAQVRQGRWDTIIVLFAAGLICGFFWEMWNVNSMPKWIYEVPFVDRPKLFEMPILGYGGYMPFALEVFAVWALLQGGLCGARERWLRFTHPAHSLARGAP
jgi:hypothetical protein